MFGKFGKKHNTTKAFVVEMTTVDLGCQTLLRIQQSNNNKRGVIQITRQRGIDGCSIRNFFHTTI